MAGAGRRGEVIVYTCAPQNFPQQKKCSVSARLNTVAIKLGAFEYLKYD